MGLFLVQLLLVVYQFTYVVDADRPESNARATRLTPGVVIGHLLLSILAALLWIGWKAYGDTAFAWATFAALVLAALLGTTIAQRSLLEPAEVDGPSPDPADHLTAESRIPVVSQVLLGAMTLVLVVFVFLVAVGVWG